MAEVDRRDRRAALKILLGLGLIFLLIAAAFWLAVPDVSLLVEVHFAPGVGLKQAAVIAFFVTAGLLIVFAVFAGDGLLGEIQYMIGAFFSFFVILWLMIAWIF